MVGSQVRSGYTLEAEGDWSGTSSLATRPSVRVTWFMEFLNTFTGFYKGSMRVPLKGSVPKDRSYYGCSDRNIDQEGPYMLLLWS